LPEENPETTKPFVSLGLGSVDKQYPFATSGLLPLFNNDPVNNAE
jgi:hypothetical protein